MKVFFLACNLDNLNLSVVSFYEFGLSTLPWQKSLIKMDLFVSSIHFFQNCN